MSSRQLKPLKANMCFCAPLNFPKDRNNDFMNSSKIKDNSAQSLMQQLLKAFLQTHPSEVGFNSLSSTHTVCRNHF